MNSLWKKGTSLLLVLVMAAALLSPTAAAAFTDVPATAWYAADVDQVQRYGVIYGVGGNKFAPNGTLTVLQALAMADRVHAAGHPDAARGYNNFQGAGWAEDSVRYARDNGILKSTDSWNINGKCSRLAMATIFYRVFPQETARERNTVVELPDLKNDSSNAPVFYLYRQGVLTGSDSFGTFRPASYVTRAEAAAIINRVLDPSKRKTFVLDKKSGVQSVNVTVETKAIPFTSRKTNLSATLHYDLVTVGGDYPFAAEINAVLEKDMKEFSVAADTRDRLSLYLNADYGTGEAYPATVTARVTHNGDGVLSVCFTASYLYDYCCEYGMTFDLSTGKQVGITKCFRKTDPVRLRAAVKAKLRAHDPDNEYSMMNMIRDDPRFSRHDKLTDYTLEELEYIVRNGELVILTPHVHTGDGGCYNEEVPCGVMLNGTIH